jgi:predicted RNA-binding protein with RPS1 domain
MDNTTLTEIKAKEQLTGKVLKTTLSGAVVDIGRDKPGVIHISQLQQEPVSKVEDVVKKGDEVRVWIRRERKGANFYDLTMVEPMALEWGEIEKGMVFKGKVTKLERFGAFVEIGAERPGLVHISELTHDYIRNTEEAISLGEEVEVKVLAVDRRKKQIKLSMKALHADPRKLIKEDLEEEKREPVLTAMEIAWKRANESGDSSQSGSDNKSAVKANVDREEIFERTLKNRRE